MRISDWSSDVCSSDLVAGGIERAGPALAGARRHAIQLGALDDPAVELIGPRMLQPAPVVRDVGVGLGEDRKSVVEGTSVSVRVDLGGRRSLKQKRHR